MNEATHCAEAAKLDRCVSCGVPMQSYKCHCGFWVNECHPCQRRKADEAKKVYIANMAESIAKKIEDDFFHGHGL